MIYMLTPELYNTLLSWSIFYIIHSLLASIAVKKAFGHAPQSPSSTYRVLYNLLSIILLAYLVFKLSQSLPIDNFQLNVLSIVGAYFCAMGVYALFLAFKAFDSKAFLGLKPETYPPQLIRSGIYQHVRHPLYTGTFFIFLGAVVIFPVPAMMGAFMATVLYIIIGIQLEEKKLIALFGEAYKDYKKEVKAIIPKVI